LRTIGEQFQRTVELRAERRQRGTGNIERVVHADLRAEFLHARGDGGGVALARAFVEHVHGEAGGAELAALVGGIAGVEDHAHLNHRHFMALGEHHFDAVLQPAALEVREGEVGETRRLGHALGAIDPAGALTRRTARSSGVVIGSAILARPRGTGRRRLPFASEVL
jgi:hypothetical protein